MMYSKSIQNLVDAFRRLPSVGQRTAERFVFYLLKSGKKEAGELTLALKNLTDNVKSCELCWDFSDESPCRICRDKNRDAAVLCVVSEPQSIPVIENTGVYNGRYFVLRGIIEPDYYEEMSRNSGTPHTAGEKLKLKELFERLKNEKINEIILALNPDLPGETTMLYLEKEISAIGGPASGGKNPSLKVTRLARGLPMGSDLQYADEITLGSAIKNRMAR